MNLVELEEMIIAGIPVRAEFQLLWEEVPKAWACLFERAAILQEMKNGPFVDVCLGVVDSCYMQLVGIPLPKGMRIPDGLTAVRIPAQRLVHHRHVGDVKEIANSFGAMYSWAKENGLQLGEFKLDFGYSRRGDEREHDLYVGLQAGTCWDQIEINA